MEEIEEIKEFLGHIQPRVGESAFTQIWETVERLENRLNKSDCISDVSGLFVLYREGAIDRIYWNGDEFQPYKAGCPTYSWDKANEYSKLLKCNFTDEE